MPISTANSATANNRRRPFCQPGGVSHTFAVSTNWLNVHAGIIKSSSLTWPRDYAVVL